MDGEVSELPIPGPVNDDDGAPGRSDVLFSLTEPEPLGSVIPVNAGRSMWASANSRRIGSVTLLNRLPMVLMAGMAMSFAALIAVPIMSMFVAAILAAPPRPRNASLSRSTSLVIGR